MSNVLSVVEKSDCKLPARNGGEGGGRWDSKNRSGRALVKMLPLATRSSTPLWSIALLA